MTFEEILTRLKLIETIKADDESAHSEEDKLREDFIEYVASRPLDHNVADTALKALLVLRSAKINFRRWCA